MLLSKLIVRQLQPHTFTFTLAYIGQRYTAGDGHGRCHEHGWNHIAVESHSWSLYCCLFVDFMKSWMKVTVKMIPTVSSHFRRRARCFVTTHMIHANRDSTTCEILCVVTPLKVRIKFNTQDKDSANDV